MSLRSRLEALDLYLIWDQLGQTHNNPGLLIEEIVQADDEARVIQIENDYAIKAIEVDKRKAQEEAAALGLNKRNIGADIASYVGNKLDNKITTQEQYLTFLADENLKEIEH